MKSKTTPYQYPQSSKDVFVTQPMLFAVRDELKVEINTRFLKLESDIAKLGAEMHRYVCLMEEQNARNIAVIDGLTALFHRQDRVEKRIDEVEKSFDNFQR